MRNTALERDILQALDSVRMVDTHEHLDSEEEFRSYHVDFGRFFVHYAGCDLVSAGLPAADLPRLQYDDHLGPREKFALMAPYWDAIRNTGYARALEIAIRDLYGMDGLCAQNVELLSERMAGNRRPGFYREVFDRAGIGVALWNRLDIRGPISRMWTDEYDRGLFVQDILTPYMNIQDATWAEGWGQPIRCLDDYLGAIEERFCAHAAQASAVKFPTAYTRPLRFEDRTRGEIEPLFNRLLNQGWERNCSAPSLEEMRAIQDYLVHFTLRLCAKHNVVAKFHTGLQEGNGNTIANSRAALLTNLFQRYPEVRFDIYHISYPYQEELVALAKNFANVAIDFCWMWIISPAAGRRALSDYLDSVPANKIHGFGGDYIFVEGSYGHALMAKENIARVLAEKVADGDTTCDHAIQVGIWLLRDNPIAWFGLKDKVPADVLGV